MESQVKLEEILRMALERVNSSLLINSEREKHQVASDLKIMAHFGRNSGQNSEPSGKIKEAVGKCVDSTREELQSVFRKFEGTIQRKLEEQFLPERNILSFFESFSDGELNDDEKLLKEIKKEVGAIDPTYFSARKNLKDQKWISDYVGQRLKETKDSVAIVCNEMLERLLKCCEVKKNSSFQGKPYGLIDSFRLLSSSSSESTGQRIAYGHGVASSPIFNEYVSLSENGDLVLRDIHNHFECFSNKIPEADDTRDSLSFSPDGDTIGIALHTKKQVSFYNGRTGQCFQRQPKSTTLPSSPSSCLWLGNNAFLVGLENGTVLSFDPKTGELCGTIAVSTGCISVMAAHQPNLDQNNLNNESKWPISNPFSHEKSEGHLEFGSRVFYAMDRVNNSIFCIDFATKAVIWSKEKYHEGCQCYKYCMRTSTDGGFLATSGHCDETIKVLDLRTKAVKWTRETGFFVWGLLWAPGDSFLIGMDFAGHLIGIHSGNGSILTRYSHKEKTYFCSMALHLESQILVVGDYNGVCHSFRLAFKN